MNRQNCCIAHQRAFSCSIIFPLCLLLLVSLQHSASAQLWGEDAAPGRGLWRLQPETDVPYSVPQPEDIEKKLATVANYVDQNCPIRWVDLDTKQPIPAGSLDVKNPGLEYGLFPLVSYEWGVTYAGMLRAAEVTGDATYFNYVKERLETIEQIGAHYIKRKKEERPRRYVAGGLIHPHSLDSCGSMTAALIKGKLSGIGQNLDQFIVPSIDYISNGQKRLSDGTLARDRPLPDSLWLDDLYMSVPALAQMGKATGETKYFDDACKQLIQMEQRMFIPELGLFQHGWVKAMDPHPAFAWGRANGWTIMSAAELLSVLPEDHPHYPTILEIYRQHIRGIVRHQGIRGFWHQLLDRPETYEETSATAMFVFSIARGINRGWLDAKSYGPAATLGWNAITTQIDASGAVHGTCVGTGIGWEPAFYNLRPTSPYASHGYGPVILAGAELLQMLKTIEERPTQHDGAIHFGDTPNW